MANEFKHKDPGAELTSAEFIAACGDGHIFACQATGDIAYASSATVLSKLGKGAAGTILNMGGSCIPAWTATPTIGSTSWCNAGHAHAASNSGGTVCANVLAGTTLKSCVVTSSLTTVGALNSGSIACGFGAIDNGSSAITTTGLISGGSLDIDNVLINGTTIGHTCDTDLMTVADASLTIKGDITVGVDDTGHDVKFFGAAAGAFMLYDQSCDQLEIRGASADATTSTGKLLLSTSLTNVNANDVIGSINFQAPAEAGGTDAIAIAAGIRAVAQATFTCAVNATDLIFYTGHSEAATEKFRFTSQNEIGIAGANYGTDGQVLTSGGAGAAVAWEDAGGGAVSAINNATANELVTIGATTTELCAESTLTYDGTTLTLGSGQIKFPSTQNGSSNANTLDDYEQGVFCPTLLDDTLCASECQAYNIQVGRYTKVGDRVHINLYIRTTSIGNLSTCNGASIGGLPFPTANVTNGAGGLAVGEGAGFNIAVGTNPTVSVIPNVSHVNLRLWDGSDGPTALRIDEWSSNGAIAISGSYEVCVC